MFLHKMLKLQFPIRKYYMTAKESAENIVDVAAHMNSLDSLHEVPINSQLRGTDRSYRPLGGGVHSTAL